MRTSTSLLHLVSSHINKGMTLDDSMLSNDVTLIFECLYEDRDGNILLSFYYCNTLTQSLAQYPCGMARMSETFQAREICVFRRIPRRSSIFFEVYF